MIEDFITKETQDILYTKDFPKDLLMPTQALVQKWLREIKDIHIILTLSNKYNYNEPPKYTSHVFRKHIQYNLLKVGTYEQMLEEGIQQALKLI